MANADFESVIPGLIPFRMPRPIASVLSRLLGISEIERVYDGLRTMGDNRPIAERLLEFLAVTCNTSEADLARIPRTGPTVVTANHPFGILEGAVLAWLLGRIRSDVRFLANGILTAVPEVRGMVIAVDPISGRSARRSNGSGLRRAFEHLREGGLLVVFPAGEVSHFRWQDRAVTDGDWNPVAARLVRIASERGCRVSVVPAFVQGANGAFFQIAGLAHPAFRTALLGRELLNKRGRRVEIRVGAAIAADKLLAIPTEREQADYLRWRTYLLSNRQRYKPRTRLPLLRRGGGPRVGLPVAPALPADRVAAEVAALPASRLMSRSGDLAAYLAPANEIPAALREIGRLREITFRAAGEGTGQPVDLDTFDSHYLHLFVWSSKKSEVVGAYRLAGTDVVRRLYTATLFQYGDEFLDRLGPALELGRSFVRQEYQRGFTPLLLLWKGIGAYVAANPRYKVLFGAVSISNRYAAVSRELMVSFLEKYALLREYSSLVRRRQPFPKRLLKGANRPAFPRCGFDIEDLSEVVADVEQSEAGVPVLLRQYLRLGGKLLGFNVDSEFSDALDGLILVDLTRTEPKLLERYLGRQEAATFLEFQRGNHGTH